MSTDFSSIDRLVEFGMGLGLAQQMITTMNSAINRMQIPGVNAGSTGQTGNSLPPFNHPRWYAVVNNRQAGPLNDGEILQLIRSNDIEDNTLMWCSGMNGWQMACNIPEINKIIVLNK